MSGRVAVQPDIHAFFVPFAFFFVSEMSRVKKGEIKAFLAVLNSRDSVRIREVRNRYFSAGLLCKLKHFC